MNNSENPISKLPLEAQFYYYETLKKIDLMSYEQLKDFTIMLFQTHILQYDYIKDVLKQQLVNDLSKNNLTL